MISAVPGWRDGFVVGETHVLSAYQGQGLGRSLITALLHPAPDATCAVLCKARKPYGHFRFPFDKGTIGLQVALALESEGWGADPMAVRERILSQEALQSARTALVLYFGGFFGGPYEG